MRRKHIEAAWRAVVLNQPLNEALIAVGYSRKSAKRRPGDFLKGSKALQTAFDVISDLSHRFQGVPPKSRAPRVRTHQLLDDIRNRRLPDPPKPKRAEILGERCPRGHKLEGADRWCPDCYRRYS